MRKIIILSVLILGIGLSSYGQSKKLLRTYGITQKTETVVKYKDGEAQDPYVSEVERYNKRGDWIERIDYQKDGGVKRRDVRNYDKRLLIEEIQDKPQEKEWTEKTPSYKHRVYTFNKKSDLIEDKELSRKGRVKQLRVYTYNKYGDRITRTTTDGEGVLETTENYTYDKKGFRVERRTLSATGELMEVKTYTYE